MRKFLIAALLAGCSAVPAEAALFVEMKGNATFYVMEQDGSWTERYEKAAHLSGYCSSENCSFQRTSFGFELSAGTYHSLGYSIDFEFDDYPADLYDGQWHSGDGSGLVSWGYIAPGYEFASVSWNRARITSDNLPPPWGGVYPDVDFRFVPEPATWLMMMGGFALAGAAMRRRTVALNYV